MIGVNRAILVGAISDTPMRRETEAGQTIATFRLCTITDLRDRDGNTREFKQWHRIVIIDEKAAEFALDNLGKGKMVYVEGTVQTRKWIDKDGFDKFRTEVVVPPFRGKLQSLERQTGGQSYTGTELPDEDDEIIY